MKDLEKKLAVLKLAQKHQLEMLKDGVHSNIEYVVFGKEKEYWEFEVGYLDDMGTGDIGCCFNEDSLNGAASYHTINPLQPEESLDTDDAS